MKPIEVRSEIAPLQKVLVHRPGAELEYLIPSILTELLFDDIPDRIKAQKEHDAFTEILRGEGVEVVYLEDLMAETLDANPGLREQFIDEYLDDADVHDSKWHKRLKEYYADVKNNREFVLRTMAGVTYQELGASPDEDMPQKDTWDTGNQYDRNPLSDRGYLLVNPMPNLYFTRDPFASVGNGVVLNKMYSVTRHRETIYSDYIFQYHPDYRGQVENFYGRHSAYHIEGGDIFTIDAHTLFVGISQRTEAEAVLHLADNLFFKHPNSGIDRVFTMKIPSKRAFMHLDTVFTMIDYDTFTYHPAITGTLRIYELTPDDIHRSVKVEKKQGTLEEILQRVLGISKVRLLPCGGGNEIAAEREQWTDGSNTLAIAPGKVVVYQRNYATNALLKKNGFEVIELDADNLTVGRGGPRCMSMPLVRGESIHR